MSDNLFETGNASIHTAFRLAEDREADRSMSYAQISIAISLQRIAEALETANWGGFGTQSALDGPMGDELRKAGMIAPVGCPDEAHTGAECRPPASPVGDVYDPKLSGNFLSPQDLANLCDRHRGGALPAPTVDTCARCAEENNCQVFCWCGKPERTPEHSLAPNWKTHPFALKKPVEAPVSVSQPATFESLAPTPLTHLPICATCGFTENQLNHDPKFGSHPFVASDNPDAINCGGVE